MCGSWRLFTHLLTVVRIQVLASARLMVAWQLIGIPIGVYDMCHSLRQCDFYGIDSLKARETVALGRELLGGNGILTDFHVAKAFCDLEPTYTGEGTYDINTLVTGKEITGISSFKVAALTQQSRL
ncbi:hypothetical protein HYC85_006840 [Camellia sinensis]|uniref:Uncharacterized protein n=1 Tax=Camellia sinensis TaxID=4442 RepID=A0A7J7HPQ1_CAMSI|nr:hypothetical protein HYC85_006840 [Camellia sinensis]